MSNANLKLRNTSGLLQIDTQKSISSGSEQDEELTELNHTLIRSLRNDREQCWVANTYVEKTTAISNNRKPFRPTKEMCVGNPDASGTISKEPGLLSALDLGD